MGNGVQYFFRNALEMLFLLCESKQVKPREQFGIREKKIKESTEYNQPEPSFRARIERGRQFSRLILKHDKIQTDYWSFRERLSSLITRAELPVLIKIICSPHRYLRPDMEKLDIELGGLIELNECLHPPTERELQQKRQSKMMAENSIMFD